MEGFIVLVLFEMLDHNHNHK